MTKEPGLSGRARCGRMTTGPPPENWTFYGAPPWPWLHPTSKLCSALLAIFQVLIDRQNGIAWSFISVLESDAARVYDLDVTRIWKIQNPTAMWEVVVSGRIASRPCSNGHNAKGTLPCDNQLSVFRFSFSFFERSPKPGIPPQKKVCFPNRNKKKIIALSVSGNLMTFMVLILIFTHYLHFRT